MSLPYRPDLWHDPKTGKSTPHRAALGFLYKLVQEGCTDDEAIHGLASEFRYLNSLWDAYLFVTRNRWRAEHYIRQHEKIRASKDHNFKGVLAALKRVGAAKAKDLKVVGQGRGGRHATYLSTICIERHLRRARKAGLVTVDRRGVWRLVDQVDLLTVANPPCLDPFVSLDDRDYQPDLAEQCHTPEDLPIEQVNASYLLASRTLTSSFKANYASRSSVNNYANDQLQQSRAKFALADEHFQSQAARDCEDVHAHVPAEDEHVSAARMHVPVACTREIANAYVPAERMRESADERESTDWHAPADGYAPAGRDREAANGQAPIGFVIYELERVLTRHLEKLGVKSEQQNRDETSHGDDDEHVTLSYDRMKRLLANPSSDLECVRWVG